MIKIKNFQKKNIKDLLKLKELSKKIISKERFNLNKFGKLLDKNWRLKKKLSESISNNKIDNIYKKCLRYGAIGGKILGAGSGGFLLVAVNKNKKAKLIRFLKSYKIYSFSNSDKGVEVLYKILLKMLFITGSESFIGKKPQKDVKKNIKYFGIDSKSKKSKNSKKIDIRSKNIGNYIPKRSTIIHLAAISKDPECNSNPSLCMNVNINGTLNLIKAAQKKMIKNFIFASSEWVYGDSRSKLQDENSKLQKKKFFIIRYD